VAIEIEARIVERRTFHGRAKAAGKVSHACYSQINALSRWYARGLPERRLCGLKARG
jgi:hypothetical protein